MIKVAQDTFYFNGIKKQIIENFQGEFDIDREEVGGIADYSRTGVRKIGRYHEVILSNSENDEIILFSFTAINGKWKLVMISDDISVPLL